MRQQVHLLSCTHDFNTDYWGGITISLDKSTSKVTRNTPLPTIITTTLPFWPQWFL